MKNLKKTLAVVLAFAMILSMGAVSTFAAYSDVTAGTIVSEAVDVLSGLKILTGFEDGTFKPEDTVTRAQMAAIICRMLGYEDQAQSSMGTTVFTDVPASHWASGYVNVAQAQQIINGYGNGQYGPEDLVTYEQAVKMIVSALGYDLPAAAKGGYPTGYLAIASAEGITKKANGKVGDAAARSTIAVLAYNALEVPLFEQDTWTTDGSDEYSYDNENVLTKYLDVEKWEGVVTTTPATGAAALGYDPTNTPKVILGSGNAYLWAFDGYDFKRPTGTTTFAATKTDKVDVNPYLGKSVILYVGEDELTGEDTVVAISENSDKNSSMKINATQLVVTNEKYYQTPNTIGYKEVGSSKVKDIALDTNGATTRVNFGSAISTIDQTDELAAQVKKGGVIEFISNDGDAEYEYIVVTAYTREAVVEDVVSNNGEYTFNTFKGKLPKIDTENEEQFAVVYKDGLAATVADIAANDTVSYVRVADGFDMFYASSATVTGVVESYDTDNNIVTIAGTDYEISKISGLDASKLGGEEGIFFLNVDGQIAHNETAPTAVGKYALVIGAYQDANGVDSGYVIQAVLADGTVAEYKVATTAKVVTADKKPVAATDVRTAITENGNIDTDEEFATYFSDMMSTVVRAGEAWKAQATDVDTLLVKLSISNEKVNKATLLPAAGALADGKYDVDSVSVGNKDFDGNTIVFSIKETGSTDIDSDNIKVGTVADFLVDGETYSSQIYAYDEDESNSVYGAIVGLGISAPVKPEDAVFVVSSKKTTTIDDNEAYVVTGIQNGEEKTITIYNEDGVYTDGAGTNVEDPDNLKAGDVIIIAEADADGIVSDYIELVKFDKKASVTAIDKDAVVDVTSGADAENDIYSGFGFVTLAKSSKFAINAAVTNNFGGTSQVAANNGISYKANANYTLVDYSDNFKNPVVTVEDGSDYFISDDYVTYAYVRYVDGKLADVVAYRFAKYAGVATGEIGNNDGTTVTDVTVSATKEYDFGADFAGKNGSAAVSVTAGTATVNGNKVKFDTAGAVTISVLVTADDCANRTYTFKFNVVAAS